MPDVNIIQELAESLSDQTNLPTTIERIFISERQYRLLTDALRQRNLRIEVVGASELQRLMNMLWPDDIEAD